MLIVCSQSGGFDPTWDHVFKDINETPPQIPHTGVGPRRPRRQTMTAQEIGAFNEIFNLIFDSMSEKAAESGQSSSVNVSGTGMGDLFGTLRRHSKRMKWTAESDEDLDRKKDEMDRCNSDRQLLEWAIREVFGESQLYEQEFNKAKAEMDEGVALPMLQPATYPHLIALLMKTFRDKYRDPHLALSMFDYARHLSIASYVFGCSTSAYNELIATRWTCFRDLKGVHDALEEMYVNGVDMDNKTRELAEKVRQQVGERNLWMEEDEIGSSGVWEMLNNIERLVNQKVVTNRRDPQRRRKSHGMIGEPWNKPTTLPPGWEFDKW
ncbi:hypothetical protein MVEN_00555900 [Mycena venus]|uniref:Mtf2-like C-terminal domain-containing protein n=1 Tax=Mycena venus TaxID=2733690 RepID=A0A8H6YN82_9AGAR|nr:hypothetical protein MVEN_00555900 [Mycena venus]